MPRYYIFFWLVYNLEVRYDNRIWSLIITNFFVKHSRNSKHIHENGRHTLHAVSRVSSELQPPFTLFARFLERLLANFLKALLEAPKINHPIPNAAGRLAVYMHSSRTLRKSKSAYWIWRHFTTRGLLLRKSTQIIPSGSEAMAVSSGLNHYRMDIQT